VAIRQDKTQFTQQVIFYTLAHLYIEGKISAGLAAQILGCTRLEFYWRLSDNGFAVIDYAEEDLDSEVSTSCALATQIATPITYSTGATNP
jgi:hypothetical protein